MKNPVVRTRFAPSPTGFLHIGGLRTALFNYLYAKKHGGTFILRLEDTDRERYVPEGIAQIEEVLSWVGLEPDEGVWRGEHSGEVGPYVQSERLPNYQKFVTKLLEEGLAYTSYTDTQRYSEWKNEAIKMGRAWVWKKHLERGHELGPTNKIVKGFPVRLDTEAIADKLIPDRIIDWNDQNRGLFTEAISNIDDFVILKADGYPTYNFANVIDDHLMQITHILRGDEFISSTPKHALLYDALDFERPTWVHLPVILGNDGSKLSKRHGDTDALQYRDKGYLPDAVVNFLALLGWNDGTEKEVFTRQELIESFSLERIQKSPAKFDLERLNWLNGVYIREIISETQYEEQALAELDRAGLPTNEVAKSAVRLERERIKFFAELPTMVDFFMHAPKPSIDMRELLIAKLPAEKVNNFLREAASALDGVVDEPDLIEAALRDRTQELEIKPGEFFATIRIAITGRTQAPGLFETIATMKVYEARARLLAAEKLFA